MEKKSETRTLSIIFKWYVLDPIALPLAVKKSEENIRNQILSLYSFPEDENHNSI